MIKIDKDFQDNYNIIGIHINWIFQNSFRFDYYYCRKNGYRIVAYNVYRCDKEIGLYWMEGSYIMMEWYEENNLTIYSLIIR